MPGLQYLLNLLGDNVTDSRIIVPVPLSDKIEILDDQDYLCADTVYIAPSVTADLFLRKEPVIEDGALLITSDTDSLLNDELVSRFPINLIQTRMKSAALYNLLSRMFRKIEAWERNFERLSRPGANVREILQYIADESGASVYLIEDERYTSVSRNERISAWLASNFFRNGVLNEKWIAEFKNACTPCGGFLRHYSDKMGIAVYFRQIQNRGGLGLYIVLAYENSGNLDHAFGKLAVDTISAKLSSGTDPALLEDSSAFGKFWQDILSKKYIGKTEIYDQLNKFRNSPLLFVRVILIVFENKEWDDAACWKIICQLNELFPGCTITFGGGEAVILMYHNERILNLKLDEPKINAFLMKYDAYMAVGNNTRDYSMLRTHYLLSKRTISLAKKLNVEKESRICRQIRYNEYCIIDFCVERFVEEFGHDDIIYLMHPAVVQILRYDKKYNNNLEDVLHSYLINDCNVTRTAEEMYMHRNTIINKINKIMSLIDADLSDPRVRQQLLFSQQVLRYYEKVMNLEVN